MRNSNSKETRRAVEAYVLSVIENQTEEDAPATTRPVARFFDMLKDWMKYEDHKEADRLIVGAELAKEYRAAGRYNGYTAAVTPYWNWYLAVYKAAFEAYTDDVCNNLKLWLDETEEEVERYSCDQAWSLYSHLSAAAFERLYDRENTPHRIPTSEFKRILQEDSQEHHFFDRKVMKYHKQTMRDITVYGFFLITSKADGKEHDCYRVESMQASDPESPRHLVTYYFDRETLKFVFPKEA